MDQRKIPQIMQNAQPNTGRIGSNGLCVPQAATTLAQGQQHPPSCLPPLCVDGGGLRGGDFGTQDGNYAVQPPQPMFEEFAGITLDRVKETFCQRGDQYGDTLREAKFLKMRAVARSLGVHIPEKFLRAIALGAMLDIKYWRNLGGYKDDSLIDEMAYDAVLAETMKRHKEGKPL